MTESYQQRMLFSKTDLFIFENQVIMKFCRV